MKKLLRVPSWRTIGWINVAVVILCGYAVIVSLLYDGNPVLIALNAFCVGSSMAAIFYIRNIVQMRAAFDELSGAFKAMSEIANAMVNSEVERISGLHDTDDDDTPIAPKLH